MSNDGRSAIQYCIDRMSILAAESAAQDEYDRIIKDVRRVHQLLKRGETTQDHGLEGNLRCIIDHLTDIPSVL